MLFFTFQVCNIPLFQFLLCMVFSQFFLSRADRESLDNGVGKVLYQHIYAWLHYTPYKYIQGSKLRLIQLQKQLSFSVLYINNSQSTSNIYSVSNKALRCLSSCHCGVVSNALNRIMQKYAIVHDFKPINFTKLHFDELSDTVLYCLNKNMHKGICMKFQLTQILCIHTL